MTYKERKEKMDYLLVRIQKGWCYNLALFALKISCSKRTVERMLSDLREEGYVIKYCRMRNRYFGTKIFVNLSTSPRHEVLLNKVVERNIFKISGKVVTKTLYYAMDPMQGQYTRIANSFLNSSNIWYLYP